MAGAHFRGFGGDKMDVVQQIYKQCDPNNTDLIPVSVLIDFVKQFLPDNLEDVESLRTELDPNQTDPSVSRTRFSQVIELWATNLKQKYSEKFKASLAQLRIQQIEEFTARSTLDTREHSNDSAPGNDEEKRKLQLQLDELKTELELSKQQLCVSEARNTRLQADMKKITDSYKSELDVLQRRLKEIELENKRLKEKSIELKEDKMKPMENKGKSGAQGDQLTGLSDMEKQSSNVAVFYTKENNAALLQEKTEIFLVENEASSSQTLTNAPSANSSPSCVSSASQKANSPSSVSSANANSISNSLLRTVLIKSRSAPLATNFGEVSLLSPTDRMDLIKCHSAVVFNADSPPTMYVIERSPNHDSQLPDLSNKQGASGDNCCKSPRGTTQGKSKDANAGSDDQLNPVIDTCIQTEESFEHIARIKEKLTDLESEKSFRRQVKTNLEELWLANAITIGKCEKLTLSIFKKLNKYAHAEQLDDNCELYHAVESLNTVVDNITNQLDASYENREKNVVYITKYEIKIAELEKTVGTLQEKLEMARKEADRNRDKLQTTLRDFISEKLSKDNLKQQLESLTGAKKQLECELEDSVRVQLKNRSEIEKLENDLKERKEQIVDLMTKIKMEEVTSFMAKSNTDLRRTTSNILNRVKPQLPNETASGGGLFQSFEEQPTVKSSCSTLEEEMHNLHNNIILAMRLLEAITERYNNLRSLLKSSAASKAKPLHKRSKCSYVAQFFLNCLFGLIFLTICFLYYAQWECFK